MKTEEQIKEEHKQILRDIEIINKKEVKYNTELGKVNINLVDIP
jgi:hemerythrin-like domain-containing protein